MPRQVYWDSCVFLGLLSAEAGKINACRDVWEEAVAGKSIIVTSTFTFAEVYRARCEAGLTKPLLEAEDKRIEELLGQRFITRVLVDEQIGVAARRLLRSYPECKKPSDGIHLASALRLDVDEMHTFDGADLLKLDGKILKRNTHPLRICRPAVIPVVLPLPTTAPTQGDLLFGEPTA